MYKEMIIPRKDMERIGDLLSYFIAQRELGKPVASLKQTLKDLRILIFKIIVRYYFQLPLRLEDEFFFELTEFLEETRDDIFEECADKNYIDYCIDKIIDCFDHARNIKHKGKSGTLGDSANPNLPILKPFDLNLRPFIRLVKSDGAIHT